ncbi:unnamed protein product, partial [Urochloa humidicola]
ARLLAQASRPDGGSSACNAGEETGPQAAAARVGAPLAESRRFPAAAGGAVPASTGGRISAGARGAKTLWWSDLRRRSSPGRRGL